MQIAARHSDRTKLKVPVQLVVPDSSGSRIISAETMDASAYGARLCCTDASITVGQIVTIVYKQQECKFRVAWIGDSGTQQEHQVGIECLESDRNIWGINFQDSSNILEPVLLGCPWEVPQAS